VTVKENPLTCTYIIVIPNRRSIQGPFGNFFTVLQLTLKKAGILKLLAEVDAVRVLRVEEPLLGLVHQSADPRRTGSWEMR